MASAAFDTLKAARALESAGVERAQAARPSGESYERNVKLIRLQRV